MKLIPVILALVLITGHPKTKTAKPAKKAKPANHEKTIEEEAWGSKPQNGMDTPTVYLRKLKSKKPLTPDDDTADLERVSGDSSAMPYSSPSRKSVSLRPQRRSIALPHAPSVNQNNLYRKRLGIQTYNFMRSRMKFLNTFHPIYGRRH